MENLNQTYLKFSKEGLNGISPFITSINSEENVILELLNLNIDRINFITELLAEQACDYNDIFELLAGYPDELNFCKQLFIHRNISEMNMVYLYGINMVKPIILPLIINHFELNESAVDLDTLWVTFVETWCSQLDANNLTANSMKCISEETGEIIIKLNKYSNHHTKLS